MVTDSTIKKGYKQTELGVIPEDWKIGKLGDFVKITSGESPSKFIFKSSGTPYYKVEQLNNSEKYQKETPYYIESNNAIPRGSIIFPKRGASILLNKVRILVEDSYMDTNLMTLTLSEGLCSEFAYYMLTHIELWRIADTTSIPQINNKHINPILITFPSIEEQAAIATVLSDTDALIKSLERLIAKKKDIKQGTMQQLLTGKKRLPGFSGEWEINRLGDIADIIKGRGLSKSKLATSCKKKCILYGELFTTYSRIIKDIVSRTDCNDGVLSKYGDVLMPGSTTTVGIDLAIATTLLEEGVLLGGDINIIRKKTEKYISEFLAYYLTQVEKNKISEITQGITIIHLYGRDLLDLEIKIPTEIVEQTAIARIITDMDAEIESLEQKRDKYKMLKQGMMQQLLTGKIRLL